MMIRTARALPVVALLLTASPLVATASLAQADDVGRLQASIRNSVAAKGRDFANEVRGYFEAFLLVRSCNALNRSDTVYVADADLSSARWWMHRFQSALKLEAPLLARVAIRTDELWTAAETSTAPFRRRAAPGSSRASDALTPGEIRTTCTTALDVFRSGEDGGPTKLGF